MFSKALGLGRSAARGPLACSQRTLRTSAPALTVYNNILETVGKTPVVRINSIAPAGVDVYAKCEFMNPLGSVKDRLAMAIIQHAEATGQLKPGMTVVEASSGNTGIGLAMVCAQRGYNCVITMSETFSIERRKIMRALGAKVVLTPGGERGTGMVKKAQELAEKNGWLLCRQFENEANPAYHAMTTGPEILSDFANKRLDYFVTGYGTGGTFQGAGKVLKKGRPGIRIVLSEPANATLIQSGQAQERDTSGAPVKSHPAFAPHWIQGWTPDFIPKVTEDGLQMDLMDEIMPISQEEAVSTAHALARKEGLFTGISGGATMAAALKIAKDAPAGSGVLAMLPDTAERYLSTPLFAAIQDGMNEEEWEISHSTPNHQLPPPAQ